MTVESEAVECYWVQRSRSISECPSPLQVTTRRSLWGCSRSSCRTSLNDPQFSAGRYCCEEQTCQPLLIYFRAFRFDQYCFRDVSAVATTEPKTVDSSEYRRHAWIVCCVFQV